MKLVMELSRSHSRQLSRYLHLNLRCLNLTNAPWIKVPWLHEASPCRWMMQYFLTFHVLFTVLAVSALRLAVHIMYVWATSWILSTRSLGGLSFRKESLVNLTWANCNRSLLARLLCHYLTCCTRWFLTLLFRLCSIKYPWGKGTFFLLEGGGQPLHPPDTQ